MARKTPPEKLLIGAHTSAAGGVDQALLRGQDIGATTIQLFTSNQKQWKGRELTEEHLARWDDALEETELSALMSHDSYLINLGSPDKEMLKKSRNAFEEELKRCQLLGLDFLNFHPGAATTGTEEQCLETIVKSMLSFEKSAAKGDTRLLLETTAGQGTSVGHLFEHLAYIIDRVKKKVPIGVCIDTCHIFSAGYDIRTPKTWDTTLKEFDKVIGLEHLYAMHVNDSKRKFGERRDRHASLGEGEIGIDCFKFMMQDKRLREIPKYLETPDVNLWKDEIAMLRKFAA